jgi:hypothetical protein
LRLRLGVKFKHPVVTQAISLMNKIKQIYHKYCITRAAVDTQIGGPRDHTSVAKQTSFGSNNWDT